MSREDPAIAARLHELLAEGVREGVFPSAAAWIAADHRPRARAFVGGATPRTRWDLASLTKPMAVGTLAMREVAAGRLDLDERAGAPLGIDDAEAPTVRELLRHRSGLPAWDDLAAAADAAVPGWRPGEPAVRGAVRGRLGALAARAAPTPATCYSDLGYVALGWLLERRLGHRLDRLFSGFRPPAPAGPAARPERFAPTGDDPPRRARELRGEVNDRNAWVLGGGAGHAGLFAPIEAVGGWALGLARAAAGSSGGIDGGVVRTFWDPAHRAEDGTWVLGWDTPSATGSSAGRHASPDAVGHLGFTGTSVWVDRAQGLVMVLLTNRVALGPERASAIRAFRPRFHDAVRELLARGRSSPHEAR